MAYSFEGFTQSFERRGLHLAGIAAPAAAPAPPYPTRRPGPTTTSDEPGRYFRNGTPAAHDQEHLRTIATNMQWAMLAAIMKALNWQWYHIKHRSPNAGEIRDEALARLGECIHEARTNGQHHASLRTGGLEYVASTCDETGDVLCLSCAFVLDSWESTDTTPYRPTEHV